MLAALLFSLSMYSCSAPPTAPIAGEKPQTVAADGITPSLMRSAAKPSYNLEKIGDVVNPFEKQPVTVSGSETLTVAGWAVDAEHKGIPAGVEVVVDGKAYRAEAGQDRADVAGHFKIPAYLKSGFTFSAPASVFGPGKHVVAIRIIASDKKSYLEGLGVAVDIR